MHRYDYDGRYVYCSPTIEGYQGNIVMILDLADPKQPEEVGRWWMPGQWTAGGETPTLERNGAPLPSSAAVRQPALHQLLARRLRHPRTSKTCRNPKFVSGLDWSPPYPCPTHSAVPIPFESTAVRYLLVADEDVARCSPSPPAFVWLVDVTDETRPVPISTFQMDQLEGTTQPPQTGCHQPVEKITGSEVPVAWFANGLAYHRYRRPHAPREVAHYRSRLCRRIQNASRATTFSSTNAASSI